MHEIAESIKELRLKTKLSQKRFGYKIGISGKTISAYETGKCTPPLKILNKMANTYNISIASLTVKNDNVLLEKLNKLREDLNEITRVIEMNSIS